MKGMSMIQDLKHSLLDNIDFYNLWQFLFFKYEHEKSLYPWAWVKLFYFCSTSSILGPDHHINDEADQILFGILDIAF